MAWTKKAGRLSRSQRGVSLIEVMIAVFVTAIGLLGAAAMQLNALKYTDSSRMTSQASFIVYDIIDRIRANAEPTVLDGYDLSSTSSSPSCSGICAVDLQDFITNVQNLPEGSGSINVSGTTVTVDVSWSEGRAGGKDGSGNAQQGSFSVTTDVSVATP
jgi:type IV pilus assembly protein PilV